MVTPHRSISPLRSIHLAASIAPTSVLWLILVKPGWTEIAWAAAAATTILLTFWLQERSSRSLAFLRPRAEGPR